MLLRMDKKDSHRNYPAIQGAHIGASGGGDQLKCHAGKVFPEKLYLGRKGLILFHLFITFLKKKIILNWTEKVIQ